MPDTFTPNYNLTKPEVGSSRDAWGGKWNENADALDTAIKKVDTDAKTAIAAIKGVPSGALMFFAMNSPPAGWLKCNGASLSRTAYAALFAAIGTQYGAVDGNSFNLPDVRGLFPRVLDEGRGYDSGRGMNSIQGSQNLAHSHSAANNFRFFTEGPDYQVQQLGGSGSESLTYYTTQSGGNEARPVNMAFPLCIKI